jgi:hypothetical protein
MMALGSSPASLMLPLISVSAVGFLGSYLLAAVAAPVFLHRIGELTVPSVAATSVIVPVLLVVLVAFVSTAPVSVAALVTGAVVPLVGVRYLWLRARRPERVAAIGLYDETSSADLLRPPLPSTSEPPPRHPPPGHER